MYRTDVPKLSLMAAKICRFGRTLEKSADLDADSES